MTITKRSVFTTLTLVVFIFYLLFWLYIQLVSKTTEGTFNDIFTDTYGVLAGIGGIAGIYISKKWGLLSSFVGKAIVLLSMGLLFQFLGQLSYSVQFYIYHIENAYPSFGEIFYLLSIPSYIMGIWYIGKAAGLSIGLTSNKRKVVAILIPLAMVFISYMLFLKDYDSTDVETTVIILDYIYPISQAIFVSLAIVTFLNTRNYLGGVMRDKVLFLLFALVFQYIADTLFIHDTRLDVWYAAGLSDLMFLISYFLMTLGLIQFDTENVSKAINKHNGK